MTVIREFRDLPETNRPKLQLLRHTRSCLVTFVKDNSSNLAVAVSVAQMYKLFPDTLPENLSDTQGLCRALVTVLATARVPITVELIPSFRRDVDTCVSCLEDLWTRSGKYDLVCGDTLQARRIRRREKLFLTIKVKEKELATSLCLLLAVAD